MSISVDVKGGIRKNFYADVKGRGQSSSALHPYQNPKQIISNIVYDLGVSNTATTDEYYIGNPALEEPWKFGFSVDKKINSKKLIENIASTSPYIPRFDNIRLVYDSSDYIIKESDVIDFSFKRTSIKDVVTKVEFKYNWDYEINEFSKYRSLDIQDFACATFGVWETFPYYGLHPPIQAEPYDGVTYHHPDSTLIIDDHRGKYIRDD